MADTLMLTARDLLSRFRRPQREYRRGKSLLDADWGDGLESDSSPAAPLSTARLGVSTDRVYRAFDVSQPVAAASDLCGRERQLTELVDGVVHRRNHGFVAGHRGSGKTSLVQVFGQRIDPDGIVVLYGACDDGTSFGEFIRGYLQQLPDHVLPAGAAADYRERLAELDDDCSAAQAAELLSRIRYAHLVIITDEFDRVTDHVLRSKLAMLMKLISDGRLPVRLVFVGDKRSFRSLAGLHPSLSRQLTYVSVDPLEPASIIDMLSTCARQCDLEFTPEAAELIADVVCGSPYHARLFGLHTALEACKSDDVRIELAEAIAGIKRAFAEWALLNPDDGESLRRIAAGEHGNPDAYVRFARRVAGIRLDRASSEDDLVAATGQVDQIAGFGSAVQATDQKTHFREPTAPQFLIALSRVMEREIDDLEQRRRAHA